MLVALAVAAKVLPTGFLWSVWLPYITGAVILVVGLSTAIKEGIPHKHGLDKFIALGPTFFAIPMAVFGTEHFTAAKFIVRMVPVWIPGHLFWVLLVGACLIAAALSIAAKKHGRLAATLLGVMFLLFVFLIHIPGIAAAPRNRIFWAVALRDLLFSGGALSLAVTQAEVWRTDVKSRVITLARLLIGIPTALFGVESFVHPELAPGVPLGMLTPPLIPAHLLWGYLTGAVFIVGGLSLIVNKQTRLAATCLGAMVLLLVLAVYAPIVVANPSDIANGLNYLADTLMLSGTALAFAGAPALTDEPA